MRFGSVCSGIEAASVAWGPLGWQAAWLSEIEPFPCAVLQHHYPDVPNLGDMTTLPDRIRSGEVEAPDLFCGGTPCQAFSVAGLRKSLDDARGNLSLTFCEIANAIDERRLHDGLVPAVIFWENVPGVLSTKDNAFGCFLAGLAGDDEPVVHPQGKWKNSGVVVGPERLAVWRVLDAQYFGVAQRRRRVFVISVSLRHPRAWAIAESLLPLSEGVRGDTAPSRETRQAVAGTIEASLGRSRGAGTPTSAVIEQPYAVANCLTQRMHKGINTTPDEGQTPVITHSGNERVEQVATESGEIASTLRTGGNDHADVYNIVAGHMQVRQLQPISFGAQMSVPQVDIDLNQTLQAKNPMAMAYGIRTANTSSNGWGIQEEVTHTLDTTQGVAVAQPIPFDTTQLTSPYNYSNPKSGDPCHPLAAGADAPAVVTVAPTITATNDPSRSPQSSEVTQQVAAVHQASMQVRRLTPVECERLQGFPDNYTAIPWRKKPASECPDGPRYKALGNSWAVPVVKWIGRRIEEKLC